MIALSMLVTASRAEAKYDACNGHGSPVLIPEAPVPRNAKLWLGNLSDLGRAELRILGPGIDRMFSSWRHPLRADLGLLEPNATYELTVPYWDDLRIAEIATSEEVDLTPPEPPWIRSLSITHPSDRDHHTEPAEPDGPWSPVPANDVAIDVDLPDGAEFLDVTVATPTSSDHLVVWRGDLGSIGRSRCTHWRHLPAGTRTCVTLRAIDLADHIGLPATRCTIVVEQPGESVQRAIPRVQWPWSPGRHRHAPLGWLLPLIAIGIAQLRLMRTISK